MLTNRCSPILLKIKTLFDFFILQNVLLILCVPEIKLFAALNDVYNLYASMSF